MGFSSSPDSATTLTLTDNGRLCNASGRTGPAKFLLPQRAWARGTENPPRTDRGILARGARTDRGRFRIRGAVSAPLSGQRAPGCGVDAGAAGRDRLAAGHAQHFRTV